MALKYLMAKLILLKITFNYLQYEERPVSRFSEAKVKKSWSKQTFVYTIHFIIEYKVPLCAKVLSIHVYKVYIVTALTT